MKEKKGRKKSLGRGGFYKNRINVNVIIIKLIIKILRFQQLVRYSMNSNGGYYHYFFPHSYTVMAKNGGCCREKLC